ncbi:adenylyltransferase/cytidyltransferase family protein [Caminibacter pacificus]|nr:adenylyltransferase/cytidyltransferase family protein [Caminibacter pacificus]ROR40201.1 cytidyltransferase-like protein [Caminibacter pacificus]
MKYGVIIGRFQPFHKGHEYVVRSIIKKGYKPIIMIGSPNVKNEKNPLSFEKRKELIEMIFDDVIIEPLEDNENWDIWYEDILRIIKKHTDELEKITFFIHIKSNDKDTFIFKGKEYKGVHYVKIFEDEGFEVINLDKFTNKNQYIHATDIRKDENYAKEHLDEKIYKRLKDWGFWGNF